MIHRALPSAAVLALAALPLGGCVAAALVPIAASGAVAKRTSDIGKERKGRKSVKPVVTVGSDAVLPPAIVAPADAEEPAPAAEAPQTGDDDGFAAMSAWVMAAGGAPSGKPVQSALLEQRSLAALPRTEVCSDQRRALLIDLDLGEKPFDLTDPPSPAPGLADHLRTIRGTGVAVVWIAALPEAASADLGTILKATGLDPLGIDRTLLLRQGETRKQQILNRAAEDWCVLAIAGDRKGDFDEVFDYLRNPDGPVALALEQHVGAGWFLVPPPIR
ncbi:hypothetical protein [Novosphingobium sp. MMS21-SN21R]|uniref:hypothetical protein n=1 Tax=Novosphingobium sp. MMS21-SN21R TaxID=2969298 RepID=UPI002886FE0B|nr:hypothetical protein [Novosphingobium sp. MMS21-SN21R]MDT0509238.1 hypothetical protein [Novosphingobium sp. MMS21-SN21R]